MSSLQQVPGFFVLFVLRTRVVRGEEDVGLGICRFDREDVPRIRRDHVGGQEVDLVWGIGVAVGVEVAFVGASATEAGALDLDAEKASAGLDDQIEGELSPQGLVTRSPSSVARSMKRSSAHSPRALGWRMDMPGDIICMSSYEKSRTPPLR
jgi:hypothetical protein